MFEQTHRPSTLNVLLRASVLLAFTFVAYIPALNAPFAFDDIPNLVLNAKVQPGSITELTGALDARGSSAARPVAMVSFALNYMAGGLDPFGYHVTNLVIHAVNVLLVFGIVAGLARSTVSPPAIQRRAIEFAFASALIWAVHPVNTQAVTYIVQRMAALSATFYLAAIAVFILWRIGRLRGWLAACLIAACFALAMGSKANAATLPAALLLIDLAFFRRWERVHTWAAGAVALLGVGLAAYYAPSALTQLTEQPDHRDFTGLERLMTQSRVVWHYVSLLLWPDAGRLQLDYDFPISRSLFDPATTALAAAAILGSAAICAWSIRRWTWPAFGWLFFLLALSVESSFIMLEMVFEHRIYLPATLLIPALLASLYRMELPGRGQRVLGVAVIAVAGLLTWQTLERNRQWSDFGGFWTADLERGASVSRASINAANRYLRQGQPRKALQLLQQLGDPSYKALQQKGEALMALGRYGEAIEAFREVLEQRPLWSRTAFFIGVSLIGDRRPGDAATMLEQIERMHPTSVYAPALAAKLAIARGRPQDAVTALREALGDSSKHLAARIFLRLQLASALLELDRPNAARAQYRWVVERDPKQWVAWVQLRRLLQAGGSTEQAETIARYLRENGIDPEGSF